MTHIDNLINRITMYRLLLYGLLAFVPITFLYAYFGLLQFNPLGVAISAIILLTTCYLANKLFAHMYGAYSNSESALITALILFCIFSPPTSPLDAYMLVVVAVLAMASKYVLSFRRRHMFNPAAAAAVIIGYLGLTVASWWIANPPMLPFVAVLGFLIVQKIHRWPMVLSFVSIATAASLYRCLTMGMDVSSSFKGLFFSGPLVFIGTIMLTEPETTPPRRWQQVVNGLGVGYLANSGLHFGTTFFISPEIALILGNIFAYTTVLRRRIDLVLANVQHIGEGIFHLSFDSYKRFPYQAGQYLELTIPIKRGDWRGNRRTFTIASSPTEGRIEFGIKAGTPRSAFKTALLSMSPGDHVYSSHLAGDFTLPKDTHRKLLFIAGGIGVTPFRSMLKYIVDSGQQRDVVLIYAASNINQFVYIDIIQQAMSSGVRIAWIIDGNAQAIPPDWQGERGRLNAEMISRIVPDFRQRLCYISGPNVMVAANKRLLKRLGVPARNIKSDYFSGY